jgi:hypothetical protein
MSAGSMIDFYGIRRIFDEHGVSWEVWEAHPRLAERRRLRDRRMAARAVPDRRLATSEQRPPLDPNDGWLVFKSVREERRRTPIPPGWETMSAAALADVLRNSRSTAPVPRTRR